MRILMVSPAAFGLGAEVSGGIAGYVGDLAKGLSSAGHEVACVNAGHSYRPGVLGRSPGRSLAEELPALGGIRRFQIVNSPVLAPSLWQFAGPEDEASNTTIERAFKSVCARYKPDVVHIHGFEGFSAGIVGVAKTAGARVIISVHNYHAVCPQVYLMHGRREPCVDYEGGLLCETCEQGIDIGAERRRRASKSGLGPMIPPPPMPPVQRCDEDGEPSAETRDLWSYAHPMWRPTGASLPDPDRSVLVEGRYGERRRAFVDAMNASDAVLAVSTATAEICRRMGVHHDRLGVMTIGSWAADVQASRPAAPHDALPLRLVYLGFASYYKGLAVLIDALGLLTPEYREQVHLTVHGTGVESQRERLDAIRQSLGGVELGGAYMRADVVRLLDNAHCAVVPSVWQDNGPQTAIEARALGVPVLGARIGGIPDIIEDGTDGVLFEANDRVDLARTIAGLIRESGRANGLRRSVRPWKPMRVHAEEMGTKYESVLSSASTRARCPR